MGRREPFQSIAAIGPAVGQLAARHIDHAFRAMLRSPNGVIDRRFVRLITGEAHPFANFALLSDLDDPTTFEAAVMPLVECGAPSAVLACAPVPGEMSQRLLSLGYVPREPMPAMAVEIDKLPATELPAGYTLAPFGDGGESDEWVDAFSAGYEMPRAAAAAFRPRPTSATDPAEPFIKSFAIVNDGRPVCTSLMFCKDGVAGIYCVATLADHRRRGLGAHVTAEPLRMAHKLGYRVGVLQSSLAGHPVYRGLGFKDVAELPMFLRTAV